VELFGIDFVSHPVKVTSAAADMSEEAALAIGSLTGLETLELYHKGVTDEYAAPSPVLEQLRLTTMLTDASLPLQGHTRSRILGPCVYADHK
jgi:hypothetical protein